MASSLVVRRLGPPDRALARALFATMAATFEEPAEPLDDAYLDGLLARPDFWAVAAIDAGEIVGGVVAHVLPMTRDESRELFLFDVAVRPDRQRQGVGRRLLAFLRQEARRDGIRTTFVAAEDEDAHAVAFYRAVGGVPTPVTFFTFE